MRSHDYRPAFAPIVDKGRSTLMFAGNCSKGFTGWHCDRTCAGNFLAALAGIDAGFDIKGIFAYWIMCAPSMVHELDLWLKANHRGYKQGLATKWVTEKDVDDARITYTQLVEIEKLFEGRVCPITQLPLVFILEHKHYSLLHVAPGWAHAVVNAQSCVKVAGDFMAPNQFVAYTAAEHHLMRGVIPPTVNDYMGQAALAFQLGGKFKLTCT